MEHCPICKGPLDEREACLACLEKIAKSGKAFPKGLPEKVWVLRKRSVTEFLFITIHGRFVLFKTREQALDTLKLLEEGSVDVAGVGAEEVRTDSCWAYTVIKGLELHVAVYQQGNLN